MEMMPAFKVQTMDTTVRRRRHTRMLDVFSAKGCRTEEACHALISTLPFTTQGRNPKSFWRAGGISERAKHWREQRREHVKPGFVKSAQIELTEGPPDYVVRNSMTLRKNTGMKSS